MADKSNNIYGIHKYSKEWHDWILKSGRDAWCLELTNLSEDYGGRDLRRERINTIVRLNHGYHAGTIPSPDQYDEFAKRCAEFVKNSQGVERVHIGNEVNITKQWDAPPSGPISFDQYIQCYNKVYNAIKNVRPDVMIAPTPLATWCIAPEFGWNDWVDDTARLLKILKNKVDWIALHAYSTDNSPDTFHQIKPMNAPYSHRSHSFTVLWELMAAIPTEMRHLEVHVTETDMNLEWSKNDSGRWIQSMYHHINEWNMKPENQKILSSIIFRWMADDAKWDFSRDQRTKEDFKASLQWDYEHNYELKAPPINIQPNVLPHNGKFATVTAVDGLNLREKAVKGKILTVLVEGQTVQVHSRASGWANVSVPNTHYTGYVSEQYLKF